MNNLSSARPDIDSRRGWTTTIGASIGLFASAPTIWLFTIGVFLRPISDDLHFSRGKVSTALACFLFSTALSAPIAGRLVDRFGGRRVAIGSIVTFAISLLAIGSTPASYPAFVAIMAAAGIFSSGQTAIPYVRTVSGWFERQRGIALAVALTGIGFGAVFFPIFAQHVIATHGWRAGFYAIALIVLLVALPAVILLLRDPPEAPLTGGRETSLRNLPFNGSGFAKIATAFFLIGLAVSGLSVHLPGLLGDRGITPARVAHMMSALGIALIVGRLTAGWLVDHLHARFVGACFFFLAAAGIALAVLIPTPLSALAGIVGVGLASGAEYDLLAYLVSRYFNRSRFGTIFGYLTLVFTLGGSAGPWLVGLAYDKQRSYGLAFAALAGALVLSALLLIALGDYPAAREIES